MSSRAGASSPASTADTERVIGGLLWLAPVAAICIGLFTTQTRET